MNLERIILIIEKKAKGICSPAELQELEEWYASFTPLESEIYDELTQDPVEEERIRSSLYARIRSQLYQDEQNKSIEDAYRNDVPRGRSWWKQSLAASVALLLLAGLAVNYYLKSRSSGEAVTVMTKTDETARVLLPDSSIVWLKSGSRIRYAPQLGSEGLRELVLEGEGFFEIKHNALRPFVVHANDVDIRVLGTVFNVRVPRTGSRVETTLFKGSISIEKKNGTSDRVVLKPNQRAVYSGKSEGIKVSSLLTETRVEAKGMQPLKVPMIFDEKPFKDLLLSIEKKFDVTIYIHNRSLQNCLITADLEKESLIDILDLLKIGYGIDYGLYGKELLIKGPICN